MGFDRKITPNVPSLLFNFNTLVHKHQIDLFLSIVEVYPRRFLPSYFLLHYCLPSSWPFISSPSHLFDSNPQTLILAQLFESESEFTDFVLNELEVWYQTNHIALVFYSNKARGTFWQSRKIEHAYTVTKGIGVTRHGIGKIKSSKPN